jgi:Zn finger protein HypA/HybF involved in hydrogenase expression
MHELSLVQALARLVDDECAERRARARSVRIAVGELESVEPSSLAHAWSAVAERHGELVVDYEPARQVCASCGPILDRQPGSWLRLCPQCGSPLAVEGGRALELVEIDFQPENVPC